MTIFSATPNNIALYNNVTSVGIFHWLLTVIYQRHMASADLFRCLFFHAYVFLTYRFVTLFCCTTVATQIYTQPHCYREGSTKAIVVVMFFPVKR